MQGSLLVALFCSLGSCLAVHETFSGMGNMKCYGDMSITVRAGDEEGFLTCSPAWGSAAAPPQVNLLLKQAHQTNLFSILDVGASI